MSLLSLQSLGKPILLVVKRIFEVSDTGCFSEHPPGLEDGCVGVKDLQHGSGVAKGQQLRVDSLDGIGIPLPLQIIILRSEILSALSFVTYA